MVKDRIKRFLAERDRKRLVRRSAELARRQVAAAEAGKRLVQIRKLEKAEAEIKRLKGIEFKRSRLGKATKLGRRFLLPPGKGAARLAGRAGKAILSDPVRKGLGKRKKRKQSRTGDAPQDTMFGGFNPNFRF